MSFTFRPAVRENVPLLVGLAGGTGSGKTMSALKIARGLAGDQPFAGIDTESGRMKLYGDLFQPWEHCPFDPPFRPARYGEAVKAAQASGRFPVIVIDSTSHEHAGEGGLLDYHEDELNRLAKNDWKKREAMKMSAWIKPKMEHKRDFVNVLLQAHAHVILCFRAEEKLEQVEVDGKKKWVPKRTLTGANGWVPVCEPRLPYELTVSFLLTADAPGIPKPIKLPEMLKPFFPLDRVLSEETGQKLADWARGAKSSGDGEAAPSPPPSPDAPSDDRLARVNELKRELVAAEAITETSFAAGLKARYSTASLTDLTDPQVDDLIQQLEPLRPKEAHV